MHAAALALSSASAFLPSVHALLLDEAAAALPSPLLPGATVLPQGAGVGGGGVTLDQLTPAEASLEMERMVSEVALATATLVGQTTSDDGGDSDNDNDDDAVDRRLFADMMAAAATVSASSTPAPLLPHAAPTSWLDTDAVITAADDEVFDCEWHACELSFATHAALCAHLHDAHVAVTSAPFRCMWRSCERHPAAASVKAARAFPKRNKLVMHVRCHTGEKPFVCDACARSFARADGLAAHRKRHTRAALSSLSSSSVATGNVRGSATTKAKATPPPSSMLAAAETTPYHAIKPGLWSCRVCAQRFNDMAQLQQHERQAHAASHDALAQLTVPSAIVDSMTPWWLDTNAAPVSAGISLPVAGTFVTPPFDMRAPSSW